MTLLELQKNKKKVLKENWWNIELSNGDHTHLAKMASNHQKNLIDSPLNTTQNLVQETIYVF